MKKSVLLVTVLLFGCMFFSFTTSETTAQNLNESEIGYLPANCDEPIHFQIDSQEPCDILKVNPDTGLLSLKKRGKLKGLCGKVDGRQSAQVQVNYSVTSADGVTQNYFIILADLEEE